MRRALAGDNEAYGVLYERHLQAIFRYFYYRIGDTRQAEDMTETVFLKTWETLSQYQLGKASFRTWLYRVAHNLAVDYYRTRKRELPLSDQDQQSSPLIPLEAQIEAEEERRRLWAAVSRLPQDYRHVLILRFVSGLSHAETAKVLNRSQGALRVLQHRALKALAQEMMADSAESHDSNE